MRTRLRLVVSALALIFVTTACTPEEIAFFLEATAPTRDVLTDDELLRLRMCESTDNYAATNPSGKYRGAYQFDFATWRTVGGTGDPAVAPPEEQDARARELYARRGHQPWPECGRFLQ